jgi:transcriptional antiterminator NusG
MADISKMSSNQYYAIRVCAGKEKKYITSARFALDGDETRIIWPRRCLSIRKAGIVKEQTSSLYPGYLFLETKNLTDRAIMMLKNLPGFVRFLKSNVDIQPLDKRDKEIVLELISHGEIIRKSRVVFDANSRIIVVDGPLKKLAGDIVKVDRRKGRAKVKLHLQGMSLLVDLGFEVMETIQDEALYQSAIPSNFRIASVSN